LSAIPNRHFAIENGGIISQSHPLIAAFDDLLQLRKLIRVDPDNRAAHFATFYAANLARSPAQLFQDLLVVFLLRAKRQGFFVEIGTTDSIHLACSIKGQS
jgi:hypothetical protein